MTAAAAGSTGRRPPQQEQLPAWSAHQEAETHPVVQEEGGKRDVLCPPTWKRACRKRLLNPNGTRGAELCRTLGSAAPQCFSSPVPWVPLGAAGHYPELHLQKGVRRAGPKCCSLQRCHCSWRSQAKEAATFRSPSRLKSTAASVRHGFAVRDAVLALPASQGARRKGDFCMKNSSLRIHISSCAGKGYLATCTETAHFCAPFPPACPSLLGMYFARNSDWPPQAYRKHDAKKRKQIMWTELNFPQGVIFLPLLLLNANISWQKDAEAV